MIRRSGAAGGGSEHRRQYPHGTEPETSLRIFFIACTAGNEGDGDLQVLAQFDVAERPFGGNETLPVPEFEIRKRAAGNSHLAVRFRDFDPDTHGIKFVLKAHRERKDEFSVGGDNGRKEADPDRACSSGGDRPDPCTVSVCTDIFNQRGVEALPFHGFEHFLSPLLRHDRGVEHDAVHIERQARHGRFRRKRELELTFQRLRIRILHNISHRGFRRQAADADHGVSACDADRFVILWHVFDSNGDRRRHRPRSQILCGKKRADREKDGAENADGSVHNEKLLAQFFPATI